MIRGLLIVLQQTRPDIFDGMTVLLSHRILFKDWPVSPDDLNNEISSLAGHIGADNFNHKNSAYEEVILQVWKWIAR